MLDSAYACPGVGVDVHVAKMIYAEATFYSRLVYEQQVCIVGSGRITSWPALLDSVRPCIPHSRFLVKQMYHPR